MGIELLGLSHQFHGMAYVPDALLSEVLEGNLTAVGVEVDSIVGRSIAVGG
jgi:hypothetical protein